MATVIELTKRIEAFAISRLKQPSRAGILRVFAGLVLVSAVAASLLLPIGHALWSQVLGMTGTVRTGDFPQPGPPQGCTPGFWKQPQHFANWPEGYAPEDLVNDVFGVTATGDPTLLEALEQGGGGESALLRHAVAALLNSAHPELNFPLGTDDVIQLVQEAYDTGDFERAKDTLEEANELGCDLSRIKEDGAQQDSENLTLLVRPTATPTPTPAPAKDGGCESLVWASSESWPAPYTPDLLVSDVFEIESLGDLTLLDALLLEGESTDLLIREMTTGLLNAASTDVEFELSVAEVIEYFQATLATDDSAVISSTAALLQELNARECPWEIDLAVLATDTPTPTATPESDPPQASPSNTPVPTPTETDTPEPTATDTPEPTATDTPEPTATDTPEPTATDTPEPTPTDTPEPPPTDTPEPPPTDTPEPTPTA
jgi:hypothetical protein